MNWGNKLVVVFIVFAAGIGTLVYKAMTTKFELVSKDYYSDELRYQDKIDGQKNAAAISHVQISQDAEALLIDLPTEMKGMAITGEAWFYCKTDAVKDRKIKLAIDANGRQVIMKKQLTKGPYELKLNWQAGTNKYYTEQNIIVTE